MSYLGCKFIKFSPGGPGFGQVEMPTFDFKICIFSLKIIPFNYQKTKFKHTLNKKALILLNN